MIDIISGKRLVVAHNPHSSRAREVKRSVFERLSDVGISYEPIEVMQAPLADNIEQIAPVFKDNDVIISAGGDGSGHAIVNSVIESGRKDVSLGFLAYGNFNDFAHAFNKASSRRDPIRLLERSSVRQVNPLEVSLNDNFDRYALLYATIGWTAQAAAQFDKAPARNSLQHGLAGLAPSMGRLGLYYLQSRSKARLPSFSMNGATQADLTDVLCINGPNMARLFHADKDYSAEQQFLCRTLDVSKVVANLPFLLGSTLLGKMSGEEIEKLKLDFHKPSRIPLQCDGEIMSTTGTTTITIKKSHHQLNILTTN